MSSDPTLTDLYLLVNNLSSSVTSINSAFNNLQTNITSLNNYDTLNTQKIAEITTKNTQQDSSISILQNADQQDNNRLTALEAKFPITNSSILDGGISKTKITGLTTDLATINANITTNTNNLTALQTLETNNFTTLTNSLNTEKNLQATNYNTLSTQLSALTGSVPGANNTFQVQIDTLTTNVATETNRINTNTTSINSLNATTANHTTRLTTLETDNAQNKINIQTNTNNITTNASNITNLTNNLATLSTNLSNLTTKESTDIAGLQTQITDLSNTITTTRSSMTTNINYLSNTVDSNFTTLDGRYTTLNNTFTSNYTSLNNNLNTLTAKQTADYNTLNQNIINQSNKEIADVATLNSNITTLTNDTNTRFTTNETNITNNTSNITSNTNEINSLKSRTTTNETGISTINTNITSLQNAQTTITNSINTNTSDINTLKADNTVNKANILTNKNDIATIKQYNITNTANIATINANITTNTNDINTIKNTTIPALDNRYVLKTGDTITGTLNVSNIDSATDLFIGENASSIVIGSLTNTDSKVIVIGGPNDTVNINGSLNNIETTNLEITDKLITLNKGAVGNNTSGNAGIQIRDNGVDNKGYIKTNSTSTAFEFKAPQSNNIFRIKDTLTDPYDLVTKMAFESGLSTLQTQLTNISNTSSGLTNQITAINTALTANIPFSRIDSFPSNNANVLLGDGSFGKVTNAMINPASITVDKLVVPNDPTKFLFGDGVFRNLPAQTDPSFDPSTLRLNNILNEADISANNFKITNVAQGTNNTDAVNVLQAQTMINNAKFDPTTLRLNTISSNADVSVNNYKVINLADGVVDSDAISFGQAKTMIQNLNNYINNGVININKLNLTGNGNQFLADDGTFKTYASPDYVPPLVAVNGVYTYSGTAVNHLDDINFNYFANVTSKSPFRLNYNLNVNGVSTLMKVSCVKDFVLNKISQSCFSLNGNNLTLGTVANFYPNDNGTTVYTNTDSSGLLADGSCYFDTSSTANNLDAATVVKLSVSGGALTSTTGAPGGYLTSFNNASTNVASSFVALSGTGYNVFFDTTRFYVGNATNQFAVQTWNTSLTNYLSDVTGFRNTMITISDGINSFILTKNGSEKAYYIKINLNNGTLLSTTEYDLVYPFILSSSGGYYDQTAVDGRGIMLHTVDGSISYLTSGAAPYFRYGGSNTIFRHLQALDNDSKTITLSGSISFTALTNGTAGPDIFGAINSNNQVYFIDKGHDGSSALSSSNPRNLLNYASTNIYLLK